MRETELQCPICGHQPEMLNRSHPGYQRPATFAIAECCYCDLQFAYPRNVDCSVAYDNVYRHAATLPGYARYAWYAAHVGGREQPLQWLGAHEETYWFVVSSLEHVPRTSRIVEIGSGLGYLTFALKRAGYDARGWEVSARAVAEASARFGDLYDTVDVTNLALERTGAADVVIMTEVLEHVPDPELLLRSIREILCPGGRALLTTPNKSACALGSYWLTDNPPVHLWWFSETSIRRLAERVGFRVSFFDFSSFGSKRALVTAAPRPVLPPYFDEAGRQVFPRAGVRKVLSSAGGAMTHLSRLLRSRRTRARHAQLAAQRSESMGAVLTRC